MVRPDIALQRIAHEIVYPEQMTLKGMPHENNKQARTDWQIKTGLTT